MAQSSHPTSLETTFPKSGILSSPVLGTGYLEAPQKSSLKIRNIGTIMYPGGTSLQMGQPEAHEAEVAYTGKDSFSPTPLSSLMTECSLNHQGLFSLIYPLELE